MSRRLNRLTVWFSTILATAVWLAGCAQPRTALVAPAPDAAAYWSGKLSLKVQDPSQPNAYYGNFELSGSAQRGELVLSTPLGTTVARLRWRPGQAVLERGNEQKEFDDVQALAREATGTALPLAALFDWLAGHAVASNGWQADLSELNQGQLTAHRLTPAPEALLRLVLD